MYAISCLSWSSTQPDICSTKLSSQLFDCNHSCSISSISGPEFQSDFRRNDILKMIKDNKRQKSIKSQNRQIVTFK